MRSLILPSLAAMVLTGCGQLPTSSSSNFSESGVTRCASTPAAALPVCTVSQRDGDNGITQLRGDILTPDQIYQDGQMSFDAEGKIRTVGCPSKSDPIASRAIDCTGMVVSPGLINAHDHITYNQNAPGQWGEVRYDRRNEWRKGLNGKPKIPAPGIDRNDPNREKIITWSELRQVISGTTSIAGSGGSPGLLRNLDRQNLREGLSGTALKYATFPLGDTREVDGHTDDCDYPKVVGTDVIANPNKVFLPHVSEGIDQFANNETKCLTARGNDSQDSGPDLAAANSSFIHAIAATPADAQVFAQAKMSLVWSPRSNLSLYGNTAPVTLFSQQGINLALATDWTPSGSMNLLRELQCASSFNQSYLDNTFSDRELWLMVTANAAQASGVDEQVGALTPGHVADVAVYRQNQQRGYSAVVHAEQRDVALVLRAAKPLYGDISTIAGLTAPEESCETLALSCGSERSVCLQETSYSLAQLTQANTSSYPLAFCSAPDGEPSCTPARPSQYSGQLHAGDLDGDGIGNQQDNCQRIFNPVRPMDNGIQADVDGNGIGDLCDTDLTTRSLSTITF